MAAKQMVRKQMAGKQAVKLRGLLLAFCAFTVVSTSACSAAAQPVLPSSITIAPGSAKRLFVDGLYGQVHVRIAVPPKSVTEKPPLVLFHPSPYSSDYFKSFMPEMARDRLVIAIDTPGFGDSARPPSPPSIGDYARNARQVLDALNITTPVDMLGYHTGTLIAAEFAIQNPARVNRLVLPGVPYFTGAAREAAYKANAKPDALKKDGSHLHSKWEFSTRATEMGMSLKRGQEHFSDAAQAIPESGHAYYGVFTYPSEVQFPKISQPVLFMATTSSLRKETEAAHKVTPNSEMVVLENYTDGIFDLAVPVLAEKTRRFLDR